jgi:hypothetical protein
MTIKMETEADFQAWLKSMPKDERILIKSIFTGLTLEHSRRRFPTETKAAVRRSKLATLRLMDQAQDDNELLIGLYSIRDLGNLNMLEAHRLNP